MVDPKDVINDAIGRILALEGGESIEFIFLYGSVALYKAHKGSDVDLCIGFNGNDDDAFTFIQKTMAAVDTDRFDIKLFRQLPLYIKIEVFKGKLLHSRDESQAYELAYGTIREYEESQSGYFDYIHEEAIH